MGGDGTQGRGEILLTCYCVYCTWTLHGRNLNEVCCAVPSFPREVQRHRSHQISSFTSIQVHQTFDSGLSHPAGSAAVLTPDNLRHPNPGVRRAGARTDCQMQMGSDLCQSDHYLASTAATTGCTTYPR